MTAISANYLVQNNQLRIQDYYIQVPELNVSIKVSGLPYLAIRGLTSRDYADQAIGIAIDDVPYGSSNGLEDGYLVPDVSRSERP